PAGRLQQPALAAIAAAAIAALALVIGQILAVGIGPGYAEHVVAGVDVPADEIDRVGEGVPIGPAVAGCLLVPVPGAVQGLGVAVGGTDPGPRDDPEQVIARRNGIRNEAGLLVNNRHLHRNGRAPALV